MFITGTQQVEVEISKEELKSIVLAEIRRKLNIRNTSYLLVNDIVIDIDHGSHRGGFDHHTLETNVSEERKEQFKFYNTLEKLL